VIIILKLIFKLIIGNRNELLKGMCNRNALLKAQNGDNWTRYCITIRKIIENGLDEERLT
jgi:hypothetical protein